MRKWWMSVVMVACAWSAYGQAPIFDQGGKPSWKDRVYTGGGFGMSGGSDSYGNRYFYVGLYPIVGYRVTQNFSTGATITYQYYSYPDIDRDLHQYGISPFVRYNFGQLFLYSEYMILNSPTYDNSYRRTYNRWLMGAGFSQPVGKRGSINAMGLYDVLYNPADRVFASPWVFRVFFSI